ncbi:MAG: hypothetical protein V4710_06445, partial [Verrucomicrobiota bacterium]
HDLPRMKLMTESELRATFATPMQRVALDAGPPFDLWDCYDAIPVADFEGHDCSAGGVSYAWNDATGRFQHVHISSEDKNVFMILVLDLQSRSVHGYRLLDLNHEYGL